MDLDAMHEFLCEWQDRVEETQEGGYRIREILYRQRDDMEREYLELLVKSRAAWRVADRGPDEEPLDLGEAERVEAQMTRADALSTVLGILEELPKEAIRTCGPLGHRRGDRVHRVPPGRRGGGRSAASQHGGTPS